MICVPTIMHSGTHVLRYRVLKPFMDDMVKFHLTECDRFKRELDELPIFTSLRHPRRIMESYRRRAELKRKTRYPHDRATLDWQFRELIDNISKRSPLYLHVDDECKHIEVDVMEEFLGRPLGRDFSVSLETNARCGTHDVDIDDCPEVPQEYIDFYYGTMM